MPPPVPETLTRATRPNRTHRLGLMEQLYDFLSSLSRGKEEKS
nr:MAG TPA: hypothetical protein [Caudoviricetes sp.]